MRRNDIGRMTKRQFTKYLGTLGLGGAVLHGSSQEAIAKVTDNPRREVPRVKGYRHTNHEAMQNGEPPEREPVYHAVPRADWVDVESTKHAVRGISKRFDDPQIRIAATPDGASPSRLGISAQWIVTETADGEERKPSIPFEEFEKRVPSRASGTAGKGRNRERVKGIPVAVEKRRGRQQAFNTRYRPIPAGCQLTRGELIHAGTFTAPAFDHDTIEYVMVTASHVVKRRPGADVYQPDNFGIDAKVGEAQKMARTGDAATITLDGAYPSLKIAGTLNTYDWDIWGIRSSDSLWYMMVYGYGLYQQGRATGRNYGSIEDVTYTDIALDVNTDNGDSGGPYFAVEDGLAYLAGIHTNHVEGDAVGKTVEWAEDSLNVTF